MNMRALCYSITLALTALIVVNAGVACGRDLKAGTANYAAAVKSLKPGDTLKLSAGSYRKGLRLVGLEGTQKKPITIEGNSGGTTIFIGRPGHNTIEIDGCSHLILRNISVDGKNIPFITGINARKDCGKPPHHITLENISIRNYAASQQNVGISTCGSTTWNWIIRNCHIENVGTGMYLGISGGTNPFVNGIIENCVITNTIGYNMQIKHQKNRPAIKGMPRNGRTIIRRNVFSKATAPKGKSDGPRPNLLVGHFPTSGDGSKDQYLIYGNFFYQNTANEALFQGEGNIAFYNNVLVNTHGDAVRIAPHNDKPRAVLVFNNTVMAKGKGITVYGGAAGYTQRVFANMIFASRPIKAPKAYDNITGSFAQAKAFLVAPEKKLGSLNMHPKKVATGKYKTNDLAKFDDWDIDFDGNCSNNRRIGAYSTTRGRKLSLRPNPLSKSEGVSVDTDSLVHLKSIGKKINRGKRLGSLLKTLRSKLDDAKAGKEAALLVKILENNFEQRYARATAIKESNILGAIEAFENIAKLFSGDILAKKAKDAAALLKKDPRVRNERSAAIKWKAIAKAIEKLKSRAGGRGPSNTDFRRLNKGKIKSLLKKCRDLVEKYPGTAAGKEAKNAISFLNP